MRKFSLNKGNKYQYIKSFNEKLKFVYSNHGKWKFTKTFYVRVKGWFSHVDEILCTAEYTHIYMSDLKSEKIPKIELACIR